MKRRVVAATNKDLRAEVDSGHFREDLYHRLAVITIHVPPLRERPQEVLPLANYFLERHRATQPLRLSAPATEALLAYAWPGNVRELERLMERAVTLASSHVIELDDLPATVRGDYSTVLGPSLRRNESMRAWGSRYARLVLDRSGGNKREVLVAQG